jgi:glycosyltransferase involved in cell wall biosynthesis
VYGVPQSVLDADVADGKLTYLGETTNVPQFVGRPGVVVVVDSYYHEGLNRALMEACAMGRPCITTDIPGCREIVRDGENGYLVPVKDANALADAMERFLKLSEAEKQQMCAASYRHAAADFDVDSVLGVYDRLMSE